MPIKKIVSVLVIVAVLGINAAQATGASVKGPKAQVPTLQGVEDFGVQ